MKKSPVLLSLVLSFAALTAVAPAAHADMVPNNTADAPPADIGGPTTKELAGLKLFYNYTTGKEYELTFDADTVTFLPHKDPHAAPGTKFTPGSLHYLARRIRKDMYLVHWLVRSPTMGNIHVALLLDLAEKHVHVSALMPGGVEFFDIADIKSMEWTKGKPKA
jgi:hypothetical protein